MKQSSQSVHRENPPPLRIAHRWALIVILALLVFMVYENALSNGFVFDDVSTIENNPAIRDIRYAHIFFIRPFFFVGQRGIGPVDFDYYRPMVLMSYLADYHLWSTDPRGYHLTNILLHGVVTIMVFLLLARLGMSARASFIASALFSVHPALADSVAGVSGRSDPLCALFFLVSIYCYVWARQKEAGARTALFLCSYGSFVLALVSKENAVALPIILTAYELLRPGECVEEKLIFRVKALAPIYAVVPFYLGVRAAVVPTLTAFPQDAAEFGQRILTALHSIAAYCVMMALPHDLGFETFIPMVNSFDNPVVIIETAFFALMTAGVVAISRKLPRVAFFVVWVFACFSPFLYFFLFHPEPLFFTPPHFLYFPAIGLSALCGMALARAAKSGQSRHGTWRQRAFVAVPALVVFLFSVQTIRRNIVWRDNLTFFSTMARHAPESARIRIGLANAFLNAERPGSALSEYAKAYELARDEVDSDTDSYPLATEEGSEQARGQLRIVNHYAAGALAGMGDAYRMLGETDNAIRSYSMALRENAFDAAIHFKLARIFEEAGRFEDAIASYERALRADRNFTQAATSRQIALTKKEVYEQARRVYLTTLLSQQRDSADALYSEAIMLRVTGKQDTAIHLLREAVEKAPLHFAANLALGQLLFERGEHVAALASFSAAFASEPTSALAAYEVAVTSLALGDVIAAHEWAVRAYELEPDEFYAEFLGKVKQRLDSAQLEEPDS